MTNRMTTMDKDRLAAFVDGEMSPEESARVVMHLADHPQDQAYVDDLMAANAALSQAFAAPLDEPVPDALRDLILGSGRGTGMDMGMGRVADPVSGPVSNVVPLRASARRGAALWGGLGVALAAGLAVAVFMPRGGDMTLTPGPLAADSALHGALSTLAAGEVRVLEDGAEAMVLASLPTPDGFCREIELIRTDAGQMQVALACTRGAGWSVEVVIAENLADAAAADGFGTASGDEAQGFAPFLDRIGAGALLSPQDEAAAIARGWTP